MTQLFDDLELLESVIDWQVMRAHIWKNTAEDPDRMRRRMAEFLVYQHVPIECFVGIAVRNEGVREKVGAMVAASEVALPVRVRSGWYF